MEKLFNKTILSKILKSFSIATGFHTILVNKKGHAQFVNDQYHDDCLYCKLIKNEGLKECQESYYRAGIHAARHGGPYIFRCHAGLVSWASPLMINNEFLGAIICGQVLMFKPDDVFLREIKDMTKGLQVDLNDLNQAALGLDIVAPQRVQAAAEMLYVLTNHIIKLESKSAKQKMVNRAQEIKLNLEIEKRKALKLSLKHESKTRFINDRNTFDRENQLIAKIKFGGLFGYYNILMTILDDYHREYKNEIELFKIRLVELLVLISRSATEIGTSFNILKLKQILFKELSSIDCIESLNGWMVVSVQRIIENSFQSSSVNNRKIIKQTVDFINQNYNKNLTVTKIADVAYMSPYHLSRLFKGALGITVMEYLTIVRIEEAKKMLRDLNLNIVQIADEIGFQDPSYFSKVFKKVVGVTPSHFRKSSFV